MKAKVLAVLAAIVMGLSFTVSAKDVKNTTSKVTFLVSMHCESCQKRIENSLSFEKGVKGLNVNLPKKTVTIEYQSDKTSPDKLKAAIQKLGYTATPFNVAKTRTAKK